MTEDLLIVISAPRWHLLSWVMDWSQLERKCVELLEDPSIRVPKEELKYLNIDYTQFDEWSSDEEITIFTGIEAGYERWLETGNQDDDKFSEHGLTSDDEEVVFNTKHTIDRLDYDDADHFISDADYKNDGKSSGPAMDVEDEFAQDEQSTVEAEPEKEAAMSMEVNYAFLDSGPSVDQLRSRLALARLVPGLEGSAVPGHMRLETQVMMVQISEVLVNGSSAPNTSVTPGTAVVLRPGVTAPSIPVSTLSSAVVTTRPGQTTIRLSPVTSPRPVSSSSAGDASSGPAAKKVQYLCKQGNQTFLIEGSAVLEKLRSGGGSVQLRLPATAVRGAQTTSIVTSSSSVTKSELTEGLASRLGSLLPTPVTNVSTVSNTNLAIRQAGLTNKKPPTTLVVSRSAGAVSSGDHEKTGDNEQTQVSNNNNPSDLIRQLNLARAQGLVVLQQWGDKQVLVHKATGRWIMRQGSRLVTVPPQALGINVTDSGAVSTSPAVLSSNTMEQLAEFDSILESKFKTENSGDLGVGGNVVTVMSGDGSTKQIIQLPTTPLKKELVLGTKSNTASPVKSPPPISSSTFPKPQEDPETMKRIQAILDDYNDQIRNSPDLHNRPAPRRRTNGSGNPDSPKPDSPRSSGSGSGSSSPNNRHLGSDSLSPGSPSLASMSPVKSDSLTVAMAEISESGTITLTAAPNNSIPSHTNNTILTNSSTVRLVTSNTSNLSNTMSPVSSPGQQKLVLPSSSVQRLVLVSGADGRKMLAIRPVVVNTNNFTNTIDTNKYDMIHH